MKPSFILAAVAWVSLLLECWLIILKIIPFDFASGIPLLIFFVTAAIASGVNAPKTPKG